MYGASGLFSQTHQSHERSRTLWTPDLLSPDLRFWADDLAGSNNDPVSSFASRAGGVTVAQGISGNRPLLKTSYQNGRNAVYFDGVDDFLAASASSDALLSSAISVMVTIQFTTGINSGRRYFLGQGTANLANTWNFGVDVGNSGNSFDKAEAIIPGTFVIERGMFVYTGMRFMILAPVGTIGVDSICRDRGYVHTTNGNSVANQGTATDLIQIGRRGNLTSYFGGYLCDITACKRLISVSEREQYEGWAAHYYNIPINNGTHPYLSAPPYV